LVGKPQGKRPLRRSRHRWKDNIKIELQEVRWGIDWIDLAQDGDRWGGSCEHGNERSGAIKFEQFVDYLRTGKISKNKLLHGVSK
jgi:hypothetical protein